MADNPMALVKCQFSRGGFEHERTFTIQSPSGGFYTGIAYIKYCRRWDGRPLELDEPPPGEMMDGYVKARVLNRSGGLATILVPDGDVCDINQDLLQEDASGVLV